MKPFLFTKIKLKKLEKYARQNYIPVVRPKTKKVLLRNLPKNVENILEIGTSIGYSGSNMLLRCKNAKLTTLEKDEKAIQQAKQNFKNFGLENRVEIIADDAMISLQTLQEQNKKFDFIFLDGPKGQYVLYWEILKNLLNKNGIIFIDDIYYHGLVLDKSYNEHKHRTIVNKLRYFIEIISDSENFETQLFNIEDGYAVCRKIK